jgi:MFS family permease
MWKRLPALLICCSGVLAMMLFAFSGKVWCFYLAALAYGIYSGCMYFCLVYHSLAHPKKSTFFVAGNEIVVGITSMLSPLIGGVLADVFKFTGVAFIFAAVVIAAAFIVQLRMLVPRKLD